MLKRPQCAGCQALHVPEKGNATCDLGKQPGTCPRPMTYMDYLKELIRKDAL